MQSALRSRTALVGIATGLAASLTFCAMLSAAQETPAPTTPPNPPAQPGQPAQPPVQPPAQPTVQPGVPAQTDPAAQQASVKSTQPSATMAADPVPAMLDNGFHKLYGLDFNGAREEFEAYQKARPNDPMGKAAEAASYLFQEFNAKGILTSDFFLNDERFFKGLEGDPRANANAPFLNANSAARTMAKQILQSNPRDTNALLVLTMADGMESDYDQVIEKKQLPAVSLTKQAENEASQLLAIDPNLKDAYVALGAGHYIVGCLPGVKRAFLWFGGIHGDKEKGMEEMKNAVAQGHYLQPFAKILLALAYRREHQSKLACPLLASLSEQFPGNPLFAKELALANQAQQ